VLYVDFINWLQFKPAWQQDPFKMQIMQANTKKYQKTGK
jgi:hypothetical protein